MKIICVPKNKEALDRLNYDRIVEGDLFEISLDRSIFLELDRIGFFQIINILGDSNIDDFEDDSVFGEADLKNVLHSDIFRRQKYNLEIFKVVKKIEELFIKALECKTGVFFYF